MRFAQLRQRVVLSMALCAAGTSIHAQQAANHPATTPQAAQPERFEVASIRPSHADPKHARNNKPGSARYSARNVPLRILIAEAYDVDSDHIRSPHWIEEQYYDIEAKAEGDAPRTHKQFAPMLRQLLEERFHMSAHHETIYKAGYALVIAKGGPTLKAVDPKLSDREKNYYISRGNIHLPGASLDSFAGILGLTLGKPATNKTGIAGNYFFNLEFAPINDENSTKPSLVTALEEQFGLKLVPEKNIPIDELVVDSADRTPTEN
jgi:uncharacterized protein (TIGR03435 family)